VLALSITLGGCSVTRLLHHTAALVPVSLPLVQSFDDRVRDAREQAALAPTEPYWPYHVAELYVGADSLALAEPALREALARDATYAPALALLSKLEYDSGRHLEAIQMLEAVRQKAGHLPPELLAGLALHYGAIERTDLAATAVAGMAHSERSEVSTALVCVTLQGATPDSATALAAELVRRNPHSAACQNNYGITRLRAGDPDGARGAFEKAIDLDPKLPGPYYNLAILDKFYALDDAAAAHWFQKYQAHSTDDPDGLAKLFEPAGSGLANQKD
jgi:tetratricopeptide (TPR) repeat protein